MNNVLYKYQKQMEMSMELPSFSEMANVFRQVHEENWSELESIEEKLKDSNNQYESKNISEFIKKR